MAERTYIKFQFDKQNINKKPQDNEVQKCQNNVDNVKSKCNEIICSHCLKTGHIIKTCPSAVISYGLICFYKKQITVDVTSPSNNFFNKRTRKQGYMRGGDNNSNFRKSHNLPKIKILKKSEALNHTLKNMLGLTSSDNSNIDYNYDLNNVNVNETIEDYELKNNTEQNTNISELSFTEYNSIDTEQEKAKKQINTYKVILVQRRNTIGFIEFMRGKYEVNNHEYIIKLFNMLSFDEKRILREYDSFDAIRKIIGLGKDNIYTKEYDDAKSKFEALKTHTDGNMIFKLLDKSITRWNSPEWGVPKGRRKVWMPHGFGANNSYTGSNGCGEIEIDCAIREFVEETGIKYKNLTVYRNVKPLEELYKGINGVLYKHIYYLAMINDTDEAIANVKSVESGGQYNFEVSNVKCFGLSECHRIIRPYYVSKLNVIKKGFQLINCINQYFE